MGKERREKKKGRKERTEETREAKFKEDIEVTEDRLLNSKLKEKTTLGKEAARQKEDSKKQRCEKEGKVGERGRVRGYESLKVCWRCTHARPHRDITAHEKCFAS